MDKFRPSVITRGAVVVLLVLLAGTPLTSGGYAHAKPHQLGDGSAADQRSDGHRKRLRDCPRIKQREGPADGEDLQHETKTEREDNPGGGGRKRRCDPGGSSSGIARGDFNGDGFGDLAIGVPGEDDNHGVVNVIYGSANGLTTSDPSVPAAQLWSQSVGIAGVRPEPNDRFGSALAAGDFNDDGFSDLAIGAPGDLLVRNGIGADGRVTVIYGSPVGLTIDTSQGVPGPQHWSILDFNHPFDLLAADTEADVPAGVFLFGAALAWGDFNGDGVGDLAVGVPGGAPGRPSFPDLGFPGAGAVGILFGRRGANGGLSSTGNQVFTQRSPNIPDDPQTDDDFGGALAGGDFNGDDVTDLAIGLRFRDVPATGTQGGGTLAAAGAVVVLFGQFGVGLTGTGSLFFDENDLNISSLQGADGFAQAGARFGRALAAGDFDGDGSDDLAVGSHLKRVGGRSQAGALWVLKGPLNPGAQTLQFWHQARVFPGADLLSEVFGEGTPNEPGDQFGTTLAAGDFNADGFRDLAIGVPFEDVVVQRGVSSFETVIDAGAVIVLYGSATGLSITGRRPQFWTQQSINVEDDAESGDRFGASLTAWNFGRNGPDTRPVCLPMTRPPTCFDVPVQRADLAIGVSREDVENVRDAGAVNVLYGSQSGNGLSFFDDQLWSQGTPGVPDGPDADDFFGAALY